MKNAVALACILLAPALPAFAAADGFDYPFGPPDGTPRCPVIAQCAGGWQDVQGFRVNNHLGEDWNFGFGSDDLGVPIYAAAEGVVQYAQDVGGDGSWRGIIIVLHSGTGFHVPGGGTVQQATTLYGHLDPARINDWVTVGAHVVRGQQIGVIGPTPTESTGPHLHFEVRTNVSIGVGPGYSSDATGWVSPSDFVNANRPFELRIAPAVHITWPTTTNRAYQLVTAATPDGPYSPLGGLIEGTGGEVGTFSSATNGTRFFKVSETNVSGMDWLEGSWAGTIWQSGARLTTTNFTAHFNITNSTRQFTATYIWPGGSSCTANLGLLSYSDAEAQFYSDITSGGCIDSTVVLIRTPDPTNVACNMYVVNVGGAGGLLLKQ